MARSASPSTSPSTPPPPRSPITGSPTGSPWRPTRTRWAKAIATAHPPPPRGDPPPPPTHPLGEGNRDGHAAPGESFAVLLPDAGARQLRGGLVRLRFRRLARPL